MALRNKMYQGFDNATESTKKSTKGIPSRFNSTMDTWLSALLGMVQKNILRSFLIEIFLNQFFFDSSFPKQEVEMTSLRLNRKKEMSRMTMKRANLSDIFLKLSVQSDRISCTPLMKNNKYL